MSILNGSIQLLTLLGSLGIFLFGMKMMSEALQKIAGNRLRRILSAMTATRYYGIFAGFLVTGLVQSSSAVTVMLVSFVNAGLISLEGSIAVVMGANIGTTVTAWLVALFGFTFSISSIALPLIGLTIPLLFSRKGNRRAWGEFVLGFALLFTGLQFMKNMFPELRESVESYEFLYGYTDMGYGSVILFVMIGMVITVIIQSSSATMALTIVLADAGLIPYDLAAAMILGENIGTTVTANIAAAVANVSAKRTARAHFIINVIGVSWMLLIFYPFLGLIDRVFMLAVQVPVFDPVLPVTPEAREYLPLGLAAFHSLFNILNVIILSFILGSIATMSRYLVRRQDGHEEFSIRPIKTGLVSLSELSMLEARQSIAQMGGIIRKMFGQVIMLFNEKEEHQFYRIGRKISSKEDLIDQTRLRINEFLVTLASDELSPLGQRRVNAMRSIADNLESIGDRCYEMSKILTSKREQKIWFSPEQRANIQKLFGMVREALDCMQENLSMEYDRVSGKEAFTREININEMRNALLMEHLEGIHKKGYRADAGGIYRELFSISERLGDHVINITEAILASQEEQGARLKSNPKT